MWRVLYILSVHIIVEYCGKESETLNKSDILPLEVANVKLRRSVHQLCKFLFMDTVIADTVLTKVGHPCTSYSIHIFLMRIFDIFLFLSYLGIYQCIQVISFLVSS